MHDSISRFVNDVPAMQEDEQKYKKTTLLALLNFITAVKKRKKKSLVIFRSARYERGIKI